MMNKDLVLQLLGGTDSVYYDIVRNLTETLIQGDKDKKKRCVIMYGAPDSGKSTIADYINRIFDCGQYKQ